jgi:hypothetical protein
VFWGAVFFVDFRAAQHTIDMGEHFIVYHEDFE